MGKPSKQLMEFMALHKIDADEIWEVRAGGAWAIKHAALERVAAEKNISFEPPAMIEFSAAEKVVVLRITGKLGERQEWSFGEAAPYNCKNAYPFAMAEKRGKDRVILKLLNSHGVLYSEEEAEEFKRPNPHVTRPADIVPETEYDEHGNPVDNIPLGDDRIERLPKAKARAEYASLQSELLNIKTIPELAAWGKKNANRVETLPSDWQEILRGQYTEHQRALRKSTMEAA